MPAPMDIGPQPNGHTTMDTASQQAGPSASQVGRSRTSDRPVYKFLDELLKKVDLAIEVTLTLRPSAQTVMCGASTDFRVFYETNFAYLVPGIVEKWAPEYVQYLPFFYHAFRGHLATIAITRNLNMGEGNIILGRNPDIQAMHELDVSIVTARPNLLFFDIPANASPETQLQLRLQTPLSFSLHKWLDGLCTREIIHRHICRRLQTLICYPLEPVLEVLPRLSFLFDCATSKERVTMIKNKSMFSDHHLCMLAVFFCALDRYFWNMEFLYSDIYKVNHRKVLMTKPSLSRALHAMREEYIPSQFLLLQEFVRSFSAGSNKFSIHPNFLLHQIPRSIETVPRDVTSPRFKDGLIPAHRLLRPDEVVFGELAHRGIPLTQWIQPIVGECALATARFRQLNPDAPAGRVFVLDAAIDMHQWGEMATFDDEVLPQTTRWIHQSQDFVLHWIRKTAVSEAISAGQDVHVVHEACPGSVFETEIFPASIGSYEVTDGSLGLGATSPAVTGEAVHDDERLAAEYESTLEEGSDELALVEILSNRRDRLYTDAIQVLFRDPQERSSWVNILGHAYFQRLIGMLNRGSGTMAATPATDYPRQDPNVSEDETWESDA